MSEKEIDLSEKKEDEHDENCPWHSGLETNERIDILAMMMASTLNELETIKEKLKTLEDALRKTTGDHEKSN
ncbi:MAG: hypothetical protein ACTSV7_06355 [Candidatus Baldrarchaeia archaeon]